MSNPKIFTDYVTLSAALSAAGLPNDKETLETIFKFTEQFGTYTINVPNFSDKKIIRTSGFQAIHNMVRVHNNLKPLPIIKVGDNLYREITLAYESALNFAELFSLRPNFGVWLYCDIAIKLLKDGYAVSRLSTLYNKVCETYEKTEKIRYEYDKIKRIYILNTKRLNEKDIDILCNNFCKECSKKGINPVEELNRILAHTKNKGNFATMSTAIKMVGLKNF